MFGNEQTIRLFFNSLHLTPDLAKYEEIPLNVSIFLISDITLLAAFHAILDLCTQHHIVIRGATGSLNFFNLHALNIFHKPLLCPVFTDVPSECNNIWKLPAWYASYIMSQKIN